MIKNGVVWSWCAEQIGKIQGGGESQDIWGKKKSVREKCLFYCLMSCLGVFECTCASTLSWKEQELLPWVPCYSKSQQITPCKQLTALRKHSLFPRGCSAASVQAAMPVFPYCLGASLWCCFWCPREPISHTFNPFFTKIAPVPVGRTALLNWH